MIMIALSQMLLGVIFATLHGDVQAQCLPPENHIPNMTAEEKDALVIEARCYLYCLDYDVSILKL